MSYTSIPSEFFRRPEASWRMKSGYSVYDDIKREGALCVCVVRLMFSSSTGMSLELF